MSPFQFLLRTESLVSPCEELFTREDLKPRWEEAFEQCENYRNYLKTLPIDPKLKVKSYLLKEEDIKRLLQQGGGLDGIRIYIGHEHFSDGSFAVRLFTVGCKRGISGQYDDWKIPPRTGVLNETELGESRPCPDECGNTNDLNHP